MHNELKVRIKTLTPLWTGGVDGKVDRVHETGIIGSLRWWYEAIVRGLGGKACDSTQHECELSGKRLQQYEKLRREGKGWWQALDKVGVCDVCKVFGITGWRRKFQLEVVEDGLKDASIQHTVKAARSYTDNQGRRRTPTWYFRDPTRASAAPNTPKEGTFIIKIQTSAPGFSPKIVAGLIQFIADWAALGARAQMGFGVIELTGGRIDTQPLYEHLIANAGNCKYPDLPSLQNIFLARISPKNSGQFNDQDTFNLKYDLRRLFANDGALRHFIMGTVRGQRIAAKVKMSRPYRGNREIRVWGWIPEVADVYRGTWNRDKVVNKIYQHLKASYTLKIWREMNSPRDSVSPDNSDAQAFLRSLLELGGTHKREEQL